MSNYEPLRYLREDKNILLVLLNLPFEDDALLSRLWKSATLTVCCDGAANHLYDTNRKHTNIYPDFICGDLDSIQTSVKEYFMKKGTKIQYLHDQNETDFTKSTRFAANYCEENNIKYDAIVAYPAFGGRIDQMLAIINTLYKIESFQKKSCYLLSSLDVACLIKPGCSKICVNTGYEGEWCGLIPVGTGAEKVTTAGLKYNLNHQPMEFGTLISTSNSLDGTLNHVTVTTTHHLLWVLGYKYESTEDHWEE